MNQEKPIFPRPDTRRKRLPPYGKKLLLQLQRARYSAITIRVALGPDAISKAGALYQARNGEYPTIEPAVFWLAWPGTEDARLVDWSIVCGYGVLGLMPSPYTLPDWHKALLLILWHDAGAAGVAITDKRGGLWTLADVPALLQEGTVA